MKYYFPLALVAFLSISCEKDPQSYEDCVLQKVKSGMSKEGVELVTQACAMKFAKLSPTPLPLSLSQLAALDGRAGLDYGSHYSGSVYNSLEDITVTELDINITTSLNGLKVTKTYRADVTIPPKTTGAFGFDIIIGDKGSVYEWSILSAKGRKAS